MYCKKCGEQNPDLSVNRSRCGEPLTRTAPVAVPPQQVPSHLAPAILVTLFCCMPFGVVAIVYAAQSMGKTGAGDYEGALQASKRAATWCWVSLVLWAVSAVAAVAFLTALGASAP